MNPSPSAGIAKRILVVDDETALRDVLKVTLSLEGFEVQTAANGNDALKLAKESHFDLVITDLVMPDKEGIETIRELRVLEPLMKIIAMSGGQGDASRDYLPLAKMLGATTVLRKPFDRQTLLDAIRPLLESS